MPDGEQSSAKLNGETRNLTLAEVEPLLEVQPQTQSRQAGMTNNSFHKRNN
jgi:hypothetical protein